MAPPVTVAEPILVRPPEPEVDAIQKACPIEKARPMKLPIPK